ncbi:MAG: response regulator, partial [Bacteroidota bacterium]
YFRIAYETVLQAATDIQQSNRMSRETLMPHHEILVVEDNAMNRKYIGTLLKKWNYRYDMVFDGQQALEKATTKTYDIILMDLQMPVMNGYDATTAIREKEGKNKNTPIVALTASAVLQDKNRAFDLGMTDFLAKPFTPKQLENLLLKYLSAPIPKKRIPMEEKLQMDFGYLAELYLDDKEYALEMFELFLDYGIKEVNKLSLAFEAKDWPQVKQLAHKLKPSLSMVGFPAMTTVLEQLEKAAFKADEENTISYYHVFEEQYRTILPIVKQKFQEMQSSEGDLFGT